MTDVKTNYLIECLKENQRAYHFLSNEERDILHIANDEGKVLTLIQNWACEPGFTQEIGRRVTEPLVVYRLMETYK